MKKLVCKLLSMVLTLTLILSILPFSVYAEEVDSSKVNSKASSENSEIAAYSSSAMYSDGNAIYTYGIVNNSAVITDFTTLFGADAGTMDVSIPSEMGGYPVTGIDEYAFQDCVELNTIELPDSITDIASYAFSGCTYLTEISIPDSVTSIGRYAFYNCTSLSKVYYTGSMSEWATISIGSNNEDLTCATIIYSGGDVSGTCENLTWQLVDGVLTVEGTGAMPDWITESAPWNDYADLITSVVIGNNVTVIGESAFKNCTNMVSATIGTKVTGIGNSAFYNCTNLSDISIPDSVASIGSYAFYKCINLVSIVIPDGIANVDYATFSGCTSLTNVTIPDSVIEIGNFAFYNCTSLSEVYYSGSESEWAAITIGNYNENLTNTIIYYHCITPVSGSCGDNVVWELNEKGELYVYGEGAMTEWTEESLVPWYEYKDSITSLDIGYGVTNISSYSFKDCTNLKTVVIADSVTSIGRVAFNNCTSLTDITIGSGVSVIEDAFYDCISTENVYYTGTLEDWLGIEFHDMGSHPLFYAENLYIDGELLTSLEIPDTVTSIGDFAFFGYKSLTSVVIPGSVTSIGDMSFCNCRGLTSVTFESGVTSIGVEMFLYCNSLTKVIIPNSVTLVGDSAFYDCENLSEVYFTGSESEWAAIDFSYGNEYLLLATINYDYFTPVSGTFGENLTWMLNSSGELTIDGVGDMPEWESESYTPWYEYEDIITAVIIEDGVTSIGSSAFFGCENLINVSISDSVLLIDDEAFRGCTNLTNITIPDSVISIGNSVFRDCISLLSIIIPDGIITIESSTFRGCANMSEVTIPGSVISIGSNAFYGCSKLTDVYYGGTEDDWNAITIGSNNSNLTDAAIHCNGNITAENPFTDVSESDYYYSSVLWAYENSITSGSDATHFAPSEVCTRAQAVTFIWRSQGCPEPESNNNPYVDVYSNDYYYKAVLWAYENGITSGTDSTHFSPAETVTRAQVVTFIWRVAGEPGVTSTSNPFTDVYNDTFYYNAVLWANENGITTGTDTSHFGTTENCTRGQVVTFLYRAFV